VILPEQPVQRVGRGAGARGLPQRIQCDVRCRGQGRVTQGTQFLVGPRGNLVQVSHLVADRWGDRARADHVGIDQISNYVERHAKPRRKQTREVEVKAGQVAKVGIEMKK